MRGIENRDDLIDFSLFYRTEEVLASGEKIP